MTNYSPIIFHEVHGDSIKLSNGGTVACREEGFCKGITFSNRPVKVNEYIYVKITDMSTIWCGALSIGFTSNNPRSFRSSLPSFACPYLTKRPGNWAKDLDERFAKQDSILFYYVDESGAVYYGIDDEDIGVLFRGVSTSSPLWALMDIYGSTRAIQLIDYFRDIFKHSVMINHSPIVFHEIHGDNIKLSNGGTVACREEGFCKGITFSNRPVKVNEYIYVKITDISTIWCGALSIGFTSNNPASFCSSLPRFACPDLTESPGNWAKHLDERFAKQGSILFYYVDESGAVHYGIDDEDIGVFFRGVNTSSPLWALMDIYGNARAIQLIAPRSMCGGDPSSVKEESTVGIRGHVKRLYFHPTHGKNIILSKNRRVATRKDGACNSVYFFTAHPVPVEEKIILKVLDIDNESKGNLIFGVTTCDPINLGEDDMPENCEDLLDRSEYWILCRDKESCKIGDILICNISTDGKLQTSRYLKEPLKTVLYVDHTLPLWFFFYLSGKTRQVRFVGSTDVLLQTDVMKAKKTTELRKPEAEGSGCVICYEKHIDCVLYRCGHMCLCFKCAKKIFNIGSRCPVCRCKIDDVVKAYYR